MFIIPGFVIKAQIHESANSIVYRALRQQDHQTLILKVLKEDYPTPQQLAHYRTEYQVTKSLVDIPGVIKVYNLQKYQNTLVMFLEDFGGESLKIWQQQRLFNLAELLQLAISITQTLGQIHTANIIHKDINPSNIIFNPKTEQVKIIDFGISTQLNQQNTTLKNPHLLEGTLAYISPEQTGRMNRSLDYRTDFYSLGVTFYELLTKQLPFATNDGLELIHCHIAKQPLSPSQVNPEIPQLISDIVMKLMAKTAEDRYQTAYGLQSDLAECYQQIQDRGIISDFPLAQHDISHKFQLPQKLYGREQEIETLISAFNRVSLDKSEFMLIAGYSGIGKSALVQELYKPITQKRGYFIGGKFEQYQRNIPYSAVVIAFQELIKQLLTETENKLNQWRENILAALGVNGQVIVEIIPELELIIGKQPILPKLGANECQNRFNLVFQNFINVFTKPEHPLVLFLDDLQWADGASLKLIQLLMGTASPGLFLIGAYRDNEVSATHPLMLTIDEIAKTGLIINYIFLSSLDLVTVTLIISDTLKSTTEIVAPLADLVMFKTGGNPFFLNEFLKSLYTEGLLEFNYQNQQWQWDLEQIQSRSFTDNIVELMTSKIEKLSESTQYLLKLSACIGHQFNLEILATITSKSLPEIEDDLLPVIVENLVIPIGNIEEAATYSEFLKFPIIEYKFAHDRIQQAAYSLIPDNTKKVIHQQIGQILLKNNLINKREEKIFDIVNQLNWGIELMTEQSERDNLAQLNLSAGKKAKISTAYQPALNYLQLGIELLGNDSWKKQYQLTLLLYQETAEVAYLNGDFALMDRLFSVVVLQAETILNKVKIYEIKIQAYTAQSKFTEAIDTGLEILNLLGIKLPKQASQLDVLWGLLQTKLRIGLQPITSLINLPLMIAPSSKAAIRILSTITSAAYFAKPLLFSLIAFEEISLSIQWGNSSESAFAYSSYGLILCGVIGDIKTGSQFGQLAINLLSRLNAKKEKAKTEYVVYTFIKHWIEPAKAVLNPLRECYTIGLETGDLEFAVYSAQTLCSYSFFSGSPLMQLESEMAAYTQVMQQFKQERTLNFHELLHQVVLNLIGLADNPYYLIGKAYNEQVMLPILQSKNDRTAICCLYYNKLMLCFLFGEVVEAVANAEITEQYLDGMTSTLLIPHFYFYDSLARLVVAKDASTSVRKQFISKVIRNQKKMRKWANYAPENNLHKYYLIAAEISNLQGKYTLAIDYYDKAISHAKKNGYLQEEALANELTAKFYLCQQKELIAKAYMQEARYHYQLWGASAKVQDLEKRYSQLLTANQGKSKDAKTTISLTTTGSNSNLDIATFSKATQVISGEIVLENLLAKLIKIIIENAGAQKGYLILASQETLFIEAVATIDNQDVNVLQSIPIINSEIVAEAIVNYVARTQNTLVLNNATKEGQFTNDIYIQENQTKSILCVPLINQGKLISLVYLENNLTTDAFTPERVEILKLISSQAAISIENAKLYAEARENETRLIALNQAYERFVPNQFLEFLQKSSIIDVQLGDQIQLEMSVLFSDIRSFTTLSETMTPEENFKFINSYLSQMEPVITENHGFIDKYIGDAIMALFSGKADNAVRAAIGMLNILIPYNQHRAKLGFIPINIGIGIHTGSLMLGIIGGKNRMDSTVISDAVNLASRIEGLTKDYQIPLLITEQTFNKLENPDDYCLRMLDIIKVRGKSQEVVIYEVFDADATDMKAGKLANKTLFDKGINLYNQNKFIAAAELFAECMKIAPDDSVAKIYLNRAEEKYSRLKFDILKSTLGLLKPQSQEFADSFYQILFTDFPDVKFMFEQTDMKKQTDKLWQSLELMVENLHNPKFTDLLLKGLGATHVKYGVLPEHYPLVGGALIKAFKIHLGENWTTELEQAWLDAYSIIQSLIISGTE